MAKVRDEAWITTVLDNESVVAGAILAQSLRQSSTTRTLVALVGSGVSLQERKKLYSFFDVTHNLDAFLFGEDLLEEWKSRLVAISLPNYKKAVFICPNYLVLENIDYLFENWTRRATRSIQGVPEELGSSLFLFSSSPNTQLILEAALKDASTASSMARALERVRLPVAVEMIPESLKQQFSCRNGICTGEVLSTAIIEFVDSPRNGKELREMLSFEATEGTTFERMVAKEWLKFYDNVHAPPARMELEEDFYPQEPIAIIGMSCRYAGANNLEEFWNLLEEGREAITTPFGDRWTEKQWIAKPEESYRATRAGFLTVPVDQFDAKFFGVNSKDAERMDPQTRLLYEILWEALEQSGIDPTKLRGTHTGIFTGSWLNDYHFIVEDGETQEFLKGYMGNSIGAAAARLSFLLGITGPCIATESGCSGAMVSLDRAVKSLRAGECKLAVAGGVNLILKPFSSSLMPFVLSKTGKCHTWSDQADGFVRAEGCGLFVLKRLTHALKDRDNIWAIIRGSAVSQEGISHSLGTPTVEVEAMAMELALKEANVDPSQVDFVEAHGTGTRVGDPMEMAAITKAYYSPDRTSPLLVGSVKTNVGHTESCSGITGIMKAVLAMHHETIPKNLNFETLNPEINLDKLPAIIPTKNHPWPRRCDGTPRIAGVSSFGITGTDGHVILQEPPTQELHKVSLGMERPLHILKITGKTEKAVEELHSSYLKMLMEKENEEVLFSDIVHTGNAGRADFPFREIVIAEDSESAAMKMKSGQYLRAECDPSVKRKVCFLFPGQGCQYPEMAQQLYNTSPVFRVHFDHCEKLLRRNFTISVLEFILETGDSSLVSRTVFSQTSIFCVEYCLFKLWESWGVTPDYVLGHSLGEFTACVAAGILTLPDALTLVIKRSKLIDSLPNGQMLVVQADGGWVVDVLANYRFSVDVAAVNSRQQTVVAGDLEGVSKLADYCRQAGVKTIVLAATHPFHSRYMDPILEEFQEVVQSVTPLCHGDNGTPKYISSLEGKPVPPSHMDTDYWLRHTRNTVQFLSACQTLKELDVTDYLEIGPHPVLSGLVKLEIPEVTCLPSLRRGTDDWNTILMSLGKMYLLGYPINWEGFEAPYLRKKVPILPHYPFERKSYWMPGGQRSKDSHNQTRMHPLVGCRLENASSLHLFQTHLWLDNVPYIRDHSFRHRIVYPGAAYLEMMLVTAHWSSSSGTLNKLSRPSQSLHLDNFCVHAPLEPTDDGVTRLQTVVQQKDTNGGKEMSIYSQAPSDLEESRGWILHATCSIGQPKMETKVALPKWSPQRITGILETHTEDLTKTFYNKLLVGGATFGEPFHNIKRLYIPSSDEVVSEIVLLEETDKYFLHPILLDGFIQTAIGLKIMAPGFTNENLQLPVKIGRVNLLPSESILSPLESVLAHIWSEEGGFSGYLLTKDLQPLVYLEGLLLADTSVSNLESVLMEQVKRTADFWEEVWRPLTNKRNARDGILLPSLNSINLVPRPEVGEEALKDSGNEEMDRLICLYSLRTLTDLGFGGHLFPSQKGLTTDTLCGYLGIDRRHSRLLHVYLRWMQEMTEVVEWNESNATWHFREASVLHIPDSHSLICDLTKQLSSTRWNSILKDCEKVVSKLPDILRGNGDSLSILLQTDSSNHGGAVPSAGTFFKRLPDKPDIWNHCKNVIHQITKHLASSNKGAGSAGVIRILEMGAGAGIFTRDLLYLLKESFGDRFEYYLPDAASNDKSEEYQDNVILSPWDIDRSPLEQGLPLNHFDVIFAFDGLHRAKDLTASLSHIRRLLRSDGILYFTESAVMYKPLTFLLGLMESSWNYRDNHWRQHHCCVNERSWTNLLSQTGFIQPVVSQTSCKGRFGIITQVDRASSPPPSVPLDAKTWVVFVPKEVDKFRHLLDTLSTFSHVKATFQSTDDMKDYQTGSTGDVSCVTLTQKGDATVENFLRGVTSIHGIVFAWGVDTSRKEPLDLALPFLQVAQYICQQERPPMLYVVTEGVSPVTKDDAVHNPGASVLYGMARALKSENHDLFIRCIDMDATTGASLYSDTLLFELAMNTESTLEHSQRFLVAYRGSALFKPELIKSTRFSSYNKLIIPQETTDYQLVLPSSKKISDLQFKPIHIDPLCVEDDDVQIRVHAWALNFKDILTVTKPTSECDIFNSVGMDMAGIVTKVGKNIVGEGELQVGDRVYTWNFLELQMTSSMVLPSRCFRRVPPEISLEEASTLPIAFSTAYHGLVMMARMTQDDTVLIHTASGGVGLVAIQICNHFGAKVIATAGSEMKRAYLRSLGVEHVFDSRSLTYAKGVMEATRGTGVNIVLNMLTSPGFKEATLGVCAKNARFVEISRMSIWSKEEVKALRPDVEYHVLYLPYLSRENGVVWLTKMEEFVAKGIVKPVPFLRYDGLNMRQALEYFQQARHIGKIVCAMPDPERKSGDNLLFNAESTYLITGGLGGIGLEVCKWMLEKGATDVVLTGRRPPHPEVSADIGVLTQRGFRVQIFLGDVGDGEVCRELFERIAHLGKPLRGIMHCAGVIRDNLYAHQNEESFREAFNPKVSGTWNLHNFSRHLPLEHFVLFSSMSALIGLHGQPNYAAANCFLDSFAHYRRSLGLAATSINWGQWAQVGVAKDKGILGLNPVSVKRMLKSLEELLGLPQTQVAVGDLTNMSDICIASGVAKGYIVESALSGKKVNKRSQQATGTALSTEAFWEKFTQLAEASLQIPFLAQVLTSLIKEGLGLGPQDQISSTISLAHLGGDSLLVLELRNKVQSLLGSQYQSGDLIKTDRSIENISNDIHALIRGSTVTASDTTKISYELSQDLKSLLSNDSVLPEDITSFTRPPPCRPSEISTVLVVGTTGFLGGHILSALCTKEYEGIKRVVCLIRESSTVQDPVQLLVKDSPLYKDVGRHCKKLERLEGDFTQTNFGLPEEIYGNLCSSVDAVIHCAAKTNHVEPYLKIERDVSTVKDDIRTVNVTGTLNILKFAAERKVKHVYFASTFWSVGSLEQSSEGLSTCWPRGEMINWAAENDIPGYYTSKFVCEILLGQAVSRGIPCKAFRFPVITGNSLTGEVNYKNNHSIHRFMTMLQVKAVANLPVPLNNLPVDICAKTSLHLFFSNDAPLEIYFLVHPRPQRDEHFKEIALRDFGVSLDVIDNEEFARRIRQTSTPLELLSDLYTNTERMASLYSYAGLTEYAASPRTDITASVQQIVPSFGQDLETPLEYLSRDLKYALSKGYLS